MMDIEWTGEVIIGKLRSMAHDLWYFERDDGRRDMIVIDREVPINTRIALSVTTGGADDTLMIAPTKEGEPCYAILEESKS